MVRHEPIDYLALRRTELSKRALMRMRDVVVQEILAPTASLEPRPLDKSTTILPLPSQMSFTPAAPIVWQPTANTVEASHAAQLHRDMQQLHAAQSCASAAVREALADVRNAVASMYTFTPTFRIWSRFKTLSAIERWQRPDSMTLSHGYLPTFSHVTVQLGRFVTWHREEAARLKALTHFGVRIQRAFRRRRGRLAGFIDRAALRHAEWTYLSPTGSLHRLRDVAMYRGDMRRTLERMLTLVEDVHVSFRRNPSPDKQDQQDMPDDLHMSSKAVSIPAWYREDCESIEWVRSQRVAEVDCVHRAAIRDKRSEKDACMAMHMQELQTRHYISEHRWREADRRRRRGEVDKLEAMRHMEADAAAARRQEYVNTMIRQQELRVQMETDQKHQRVQAWQLKTKAIHPHVCMAEEESRTRVYVDAMAKATFLHQCKLRKRQVELDHKAEAKARMAMEREELDEITRLRKIANKIAYNQTLKRMQAADEAYRAKQAEKLFEARCRKLMHNEEMRLHRLYTEVLHRERLRERKERHLMHNEDMYMQRILDEREKLRLRTMEKTHRVEMAVEDVRSHQWQSLEAQATSMGLVRVVAIKQFGFLNGQVQAIWSARELKTLAAHVQHFPNMLRANIVLMSSIMGQKRDPPWKGVRWTLSGSKHKYAKRTVAATEAKAGADALYAGDLPQALRWLRMAFRDGYKGPTLLRNIAKCYVKLYEAHLHDNDLSTGWSWYVKACEHLALQASPSFLDEMARALYLLCRFQHAAEILARIIYSFPTYVRMPTVIFRAAMLMWHLGLYEQSTDYLLHLLESPPAPWTDLDLMFLIARLYLLDENKAHATFAYDDAFRRYRVHGFHFQYPSWKAWVGDAAVWRHFGAKALAANEYLVAKDLYQQVIKRRHDEVQVEHRQEVGIFVGKHRDGVG
ncbi:hypothetical protein B5M09_004950 [Aphanomyces astaci]|uniref:Uncharacterized protein n=1 Tax=Aphanomyces astaci TaxID=112090 RepID=A0A3R7YGN9_APHAT|nr:hypothetical protein B5M09_004950 [Aphanomyces astaci]